MIGGAGGGLGAVDRRACAELVEADALVPASSQSMNVLTIFVSDVKSLQQERRAAQGHKAVASAAADKTA